MNPVTYTQGDPPEYACTLHAARCAARGCRESTIVHPVCPRHAREVFGVEIRPSRHGCGLFAARAFQRNELIVPYLGRRFHGRADGGARGPAEAMDLACPLGAMRGRPRLLSPYAVRVTARQTTDATCWRSWASMANHPDPDEGGANAVLRGLRVARDGFADDGRRGPLPHRTRRYYLSRAVLRGASRARAFGLDRYEVWLRATRPIAAGAPILLSYCDDDPAMLRALLGVRHRTDPPLSAVCLDRGTAAGARGIRAERGDASIVARTVKKSKNRRDTAIGPGGVRHATPPL
jgi:hypothetical protein